jgi:hypothetical protein
MFAPKGRYLGHAVWLEHPGAALGDLPAGRVHGAAVLDCRAP